MKFLLKFIEHSSKFSEQFSCHCHYHIFVCLVYQKYTYAQVSVLFFFLKRKGAGTKATPISDNTQKGVEISDEFWCHLKYKHYSKQKAFENFGEGQLRTVKCSIFCILNVDQSCVIWGGEEEGKARENNKCVSPPSSEMHIRILQGWCEAYQKSTKGLQESQQKVPLELELTTKLCWHILTTSNLWLGWKVDAILTDLYKSMHSKVSLTTIKGKSSFT